MAVGADTVATLHAMRVRMAATVDRHTQDVTIAWARAWSSLREEWLDAIDVLVDVSKDGGWPSRAQIRRAKKTQAALDVTSDALDDLVRDFQVRILRDVPVLTGEAAEWEARLMGSQLPQHALSAEEIMARFDRVDPKAIHAIVERTSGRIVAASKPISMQATAALNEALVRGVAVGDHPSVVAARMLARLEGEFNGGRNRAMVVARTELLDAHRAAGRAQDLANAKSLQGWQWVASLDRRTCPACWSMHGSLHDLSESGPDGHQQCRCSRLPAVASWADLGFDVPEPPSLLPDAEDSFRSLPRDDQVAVMGKARLDLLDSGAVKWSDLAQRRSNPGWRDSIVPTPLARLAG